MHEYSDMDGLSIALADGVLRLTISADRGNVINPSVHGHLSELFRAAAADARVRIIVLTGAGDYAFSLGGDVTSMKSMLDDPERWLASVGEARDIVSSMLDCDKPLVGRINGHAIGLGATIALCCDVTCMVADAKIGDPHVKVGLAAGDGGALLWPALVGMARAKRALLTGDPVKGDEAAAIGLVTESVSREDLDVRVEWWVEHLCSVPALAQRLTKRAMNLDIRSKVAATMDALLGLQTLSYLSEDHRQCVEKALERGA